MVRRLLVLLEHNGEDLTGPSRRLCEKIGGVTSRAGGELRDEIGAVVFGPCREETLTNLGAYGLAKVFQVNGPAEDFYSPEPRLAVLLQLIQKDQPTLVLLPNTLWGREIAPMLAVRLEAGLVSDCGQADWAGQTLQVALDLYGGQYQRVCELTGLVNILLMTDRPGGTYGPGETLDVPGSAEAEIISVPAPQIVFESRSGPAVQVIETFLVPAGDLDISEADRVVGIGRAIETEADWALMKELADSVGAPIGGTRPAVDAGWIPFERQIGQTGRIIAPELYLAAGISGAQQHISGVEKAKIIAINHDPQAPILRLADLGVVGDFRKIAPLVIGKLKAVRKEGAQ